MDTINLPEPDFFTIIHNYRMTSKDKNSANRAKKLQKSNSGLSNSIIVTRRMAAELEHKK